MSELHIALGGKNLGRITKQYKIEWSDFVSEFLDNFHVSDTCMSDFAEMDREQKSVIKNAAGWFVGGAFAIGEKGVRWRNRTGLLGRSMIVLDLDHLAEFDYTVEDIQDGLVGIEYVLYSTPSSTTDDVRLRLVMPLVRGLASEKYQPVGRRIAGQVGIEAFDSTGFEEARLMYRPVCLSDGPRVFIHNKGKWLDGNAILKTYDDWRDFGAWPSSPAEGGARKSSLKAQDPTIKHGPIGAFCRVFSIHTAISNWLSDYFSIHDESTYLPTDSTGAPGARVYDDELFLYNNHETGPTSKRNLNAFDLVRILKFGDLDGDNTYDDDITKAPSHVRMLDFALSQSEVQSDLEDGEFDEVDPSMDPTNDKTPTPLREYGTIMGEIVALDDKAASRKETRGLLTRIASARFSPTDERTLTRALRNKYVEKPTAKDIENELRDIRRQATTQDEEGDIHDLELEVIEAFEDEWYPDNTIKRIGKIYWTFEDGLWRMVDSEIIEGQFGKTVIRLRKERPDDARELSAMVGETKTSALIGSLSRMMASQIASRDTCADPLMLVRRFDLPIINCRNCEIHYKANGSFEIKDHDPANFYTTRIDAEYDPDAECPLFDDFLEHTFANCDDPASMVQFTEELFGYVVNMSRWQKIWVMFYGDTNTGKSTLSEMMTALLGGASVEMKLSTLGKSNNAFKDTSLIGKQIFIDDDMDKGAILPDGDIKRISEEKNIQTPVKFGSDLRFTCRAFPLVCTNHLPRTQDIT